MQSQFRERVKHHYYEMGAQYLKKQPSSNSLRSDQGCTLNFINCNKRNRVKAFKSVDPAFAKGRKPVNLSVLGTKRGIVTMNGRKPNFIDENDRGVQTPWDAEFTRHTMTP